MNSGNAHFHFFQTGVCGATLAAGAALHWAGLETMAASLWMTGAGLVLVVAIVDTSVALWRREFGLDLIAIATIGGAIVLHEYFTAVVIGLMFASGRALEAYAENRARQEMSALLDRAPRFANRYDGTAIAQVPLDTVRPGDRLLVRAGETLPVDGTLLSGGAMLDESSLTGEPLPVSYSAGSALQSGIVNAGDAFDMLGTRSASDSTFTGIIRLVEAAQHSKAPAARLADRFALLFVPLVFGIAGLSWLATGDPNRALAVAVVATPCPLILAVPVAIVCAMSRCAQRGVLIKYGGAVEKMAQIRTLFLDKTGTLTGGNARLVAIETHTAAGRDDILRLAAFLEQLSGHVIAQAVVRAAVERGLRLSIPEHVAEAPGAGLAGVIDAKAVRAGSLDFACDGAEPPSWAASFAHRTAYDGATGVYIAIDGALCGALEMADEVRIETPRAIRLLRSLGISRVVMLTGDRRDVAMAIGNSLGVDAVLPEQTPASKLATIADARKEGPVMMVGDGINDSPALAAADIGVAMGARGAAAAAESAQVVLLVDRLDQLSFAVRIAKQTRVIAMQCVMAGMGLSIAAMIVAAFGYLPPVAGALLQEAIDIAVILNALRVLRLEKVRHGERISTEEAGRLKEEHAKLMPIIDRLGWLADRAGELPASAIRKELTALNTSLYDQILPHESRDDATVYPLMSRLIGGEDPMAALSSTHREIYRLSRTIDRLSNEQVSDAAALQDLRKTLYALDAVIRLHFSQEEEIYHNLSA